MTEKFHDKSKLRYQEKYCIKCQNACSYLLSGQGVISCLNVLLVLRLHVLLKLLRGYLVLAAVLPLAAHHPPGLRLDVGIIAGVHLHNPAIVLLLLGLGGTDHPGDGDGGGVGRGGQEAPDPGPGGHARLYAGHLGGGGGGGGPGALGAGLLTREAVVTRLVLLAATSSATASAAAAAPISTRIRQTLQT